MSKYVPIENMYDSNMYPLSKTSGEIDFILLAAWKESLITNSFCVSGFSISIK